MSLEKATISWSAKQITAMVKNGKINFDHIIQRSFVWESSRKSALIESMILGYPIPSIFAKRSVDPDKHNNIYYIMDGKQRLSTIADYMSNQFVLSKLPPVKYIDYDGNENVVDISGLSFNKLPEPIQDTIKDTMFNILYFDNLTREEEIELFKRLNAGKSLSSKSRTLISCKDLEHLLKIGKHKIFAEMLTKRALANKNQVTIIAKTWIMMNVPIDEISFEGVHLTNSVEEIAVSEEEENELNSYYDYVIKIHSWLRFKKFLITAKKIYTEIHFISLVPFLLIAKNNQYDIDKVVDWLSSFYETNSATSVNSEYNNNSLYKVARSSTIRARNNILKESFESFFN